MYQRAYGIIETLAPLHVGATAGEENGNLNLVFRDQFTQTGIVPGSSIRGRFRSEMRRDQAGSENHWYGASADTVESDSTTESVIKFEYASLLWLPVFCPGQPVVWVSCPKLLKRYQRIVGDELKNAKIPKEYTGSSTLKTLDVERKKKLFFNFGFLELKQTESLKIWFPDGEELPAVIVADNEIGMIHDMALYRQSRVRLKDNEKRVDGGGFFNTEALPEGTVMVFPIAIRATEPQQSWMPFGEGNQSGEIYLGGLESIGFGNCQITLKGEGVAA
ncbi:type III-B CRISPR module RAMP protein Cmr4 [Phormidesmis priestleyi ULC007]|uniref:Type III-B CRISPR module RAMP protein Cmr4 n=1 Tax=Phormidesmis priestleyi ULC007 TaxID=1920490 RepID=A0A2T1DLI4_9CYAN|nr:type III-B CRISPR module RAMP protein Cmr4 [Phormidesmis priestleyi]PSB21315.1 type III-B CRISPR module RAMP protein Cmr4 [Phormidesmis priestleyi ULC007]PZO50686.1 MAG: type III-B CRISPR module RAMP protein Cmr4 [Phormidesmis priestleyi]